LDEEDYGEVLEGSSETAEVRQAREETLVKESAEADARWRKLAADKDWTRVVANLEVYAYSGEKVTADPRLGDAYCDKVVAELGFGPDWRSKRPDLTDEDVAAIREVLRRKASAFWLEGTPRTTVRFVQHDTVPTGPPVKLPPHNLKGEAAAWVDAKLEEEVRRGQLERGVSAWGSPPFPTKDMPEHKKSRKRRIVVDYRRVNARTRRAVYHVRTAASVICEAAGSIWMSLLDAVTGFNHIVNTPRAKRMLAIVARSGQFLPRCLTFGPMNGPEDFCYTIDRFYSPGSRSKKRYCSEWLGYIDDLTIRTGRVLDGLWLSDAEHAARLREAAARAVHAGVQNAQEALEAQGFLGQRLGSDVRRSRKGKGVVNPEEPDESVTPVLEDEVGKVEVGFLSLRESAAQVSKHRSSSPFCGSRLQRSAVFGACLFASSSEALLLCWSWSSAMEEAL
jgi:hypothetical protein